MHHFLQRRENSTQSISNDGPKPENAPSASEPWFPKRRGSEASQQLQSPSRRRSSAIRIPPKPESPSEPHRWWKFTLRPWNDENEADWWFAGTAIPLIAATVGPLANVLSIAALVTSWRMCLVDNVDPSSCPWDGDSDNIVGDLYGHDFPDPRW